MARWIGVLVLSVGALLGCGCSHPQTVVYLSAPVGGTWAAVDASGKPLCSLPCRLEIEKDEAVVVRRHGGSKQFVLQQESMGTGTWNGTIRWHEEPTAGAAAVQGFSASLVNAGNALIDEHRRERVGAGVALSSLGTVGLLFASVLPTKRHEELWLERTTP